ncbi:hypothetical protein [Gilvimarinus algae]|uniref:Uncharacterized protein n=1 Tax=Gilvimarinus algae TaxID=3058037 RepID=A0ABT8TGN1_9GAMM|nr:hypothetical protein [Gilvimarinus sp. SDUM040014]MDO3383252.1 hypothetical protein [Gilvimarinus sp. SDUM040014]
MNTYKTIKMTALAITIAAACSWANAQNSVLFESHTLPDAVVFEPTDIMGLDAEVDLIISGPEGYYERFSFSAGGPIEFVPAALAGDNLPDGTYRYELRIMGVPGMSRDRNSDQPVTIEPIEGGFGSFSIQGGQLVTSNVAEAPYKGSSFRASKVVGEERGELVAEEQTFVSDVEVQGSLCVGVDCTTSENFGFDTIRLKENNLRIKFDDTSNSGSFPNHDWQLTANETSNGGMNKFSIDNTTTGRTPFTVEGNAPNNTLYIADEGRIGIRTTTPVVPVHMTDGNTPAVRLEQDGSSGFAAQTWDVAGNETNFFIRDVTNSSKLPFKIRPGAPTNSFFIDTDGDVGVGTDSPDAKFEVSSVASFNFFRLTATQASPNSSVDFTFTDAGADGQLRINIVDADAQEFALDADGNLTISGTLTANGSTFPDYVFADDYVLMPLNEVKKFIQKNRHLPNVPSAKEIEKDGLNMTDMQKLIMEKVEELTLYTIQQQEAIEEQRKLIAELRKEIESMRQ